MNWISIPSKGSILPPNRGKILNIMKAMFLFWHRPTCMLPISWCSIQWLKFNLKDIVSVYYPYRRKHPLEFKFVNIVIIKIHEHEVYYGSTCWKHLNNKKKMLALSLKFIQHLRHWAIEPEKYYPHSRKQVLIFFLQGKCHIFVQTTIWIESSSFIVLQFHLLLSGNGNDAVLYNTEWTSGPYGTPNRAVKFTGADDQWV